jgi:hypothetical protein
MLELFYLFMIQVVFVLLCIQFHRIGGEIRRHRRRKLDSAKLVHELGDL